MGSGLEERLRNPTSAAKTAQIICIGMIVGPWQHVFWLGSRSSIITMAPAGLVEFVDATLMQSDADVTPRKLSEVEL